MISYGEFGEIELRCSLGGGGGAGSGGTDLPQYLLDAHYWMISHGELDPLIFSYNYIASRSFNESPFSSMLAYEPAPRLSIMECYASAAITAATYDTQPMWQQLALTAQGIVEGYLVPDSVVAQAGNAYDDSIDDIIENDTLPRFQRGMQDINSIMSSTYVIGAALIENEGLRQKAKFRGDLKVQLYRDRSNLIAGAIDSIVKFHMFRVESVRNAYQLGIDTYRIGIVAEKEQVDQDFKIEELDAKWNFEVLTYGANILASVQGAVTRGAEQKVNPVASALGGTLSGASGGAALASMVGASGPAGWALLGIGGLLGGLFS